jgi:membrane-anchored mycosin MYCP
MMTASGTATDLSHWHGYAPQQLVVSTLHIDAVTQVLDAIGVRRATPPEHSEALGLALLELTDIRHGLRNVYGGTTTLPAARAKATAAATESLRTLIAEPTEVSTITDLDRLLVFLRAWFGAAHGGWTPTMGKNRYVTGSHPFGGEVGPAPGGEVIGGGEPLELREMTDGEAPLIHDGPDGEGVRVAILDTRLAAHTELIGHFIAEPAGGYLLDELPAPPRLGHATFVAGVIMQRAPRVSVEAHQILGDDDGTATAWDVAKRMAALAGRPGIAVLNMSFGCVTGDGQPPLVLARAVDLLTPNVVLVAAAGNHGAAENGVASRAVYPAAFDDVIAVGALDGTGAPARFSPNLPWVDLLAPGDKVTSTYPVSDGEPGYGGQAVWSGTSFATAHVTGVIAARMTAGGKSAREVTRELMDLKPGAECCGVRKYSIAS